MTNDDVEAGHPGRPVESGPVDISVSTAERPGSAGVTTGSAGVSDDGSPAPSDEAAAGMVDGATSPAAVTVKGRVTIAMAFLQALGMEPEEETLIPIAGEAESTDVPPPLVLASYPPERRLPPLIRHSV